MLEESKMDKINRSSLQQSRPHAVDCKKGTDITHRPWPRNNKKREGSSNTPKNETFRKYVPAQRGKGQIDKRPHARSASNFDVGGTQSTRIEEEEPEIGSVFVPGSKKQNFNHLLNFMYPSRSGTDRRCPPGIRRQTQQRVCFKYQHDLYLRAYCQFVVKETGDYKANLLDPDLPIKWEQIEEVVVRSSGKSECPICLGAPVAGRVGLCGHVYCWACILHYGAAHEKQPPPCPVCSTALHVGDMKPAAIVQWETPADEVTMRLVRRLRGSTVVEIVPPRGQLTELSGASVSPLVNQKDAPFTKLFTATKQQVLDILERDKKEINDQILAEIDTTEIIYLEQALKMLKTKEDKINMQYYVPTDDIPSTSELAEIIYEKPKPISKKVDWFDISDEDACANVEKDMSNLDLQSNLNPDAKEFNFDNNDNRIEFPLMECFEVEEDTSGNSFKEIDKQNQAKYFYFYQAEDGQQVFLHSLNVRVLNLSWGSLVAAPHVIQGTVLHKDTHFLTEQTRNHMPCTAHLPLHCAYDVVELDLKPPYVTLEALGTFTDEIERRARIRAKHERDERRRERAYHRAMEGPPKPDISSEVLFPPTYGSPPFHDTGFDEPLQSTNISPVEPLSTVNTSSSSGLSFAKMAGAGGAWRVRGAPLAAPPAAPDGDAHDHVDAATAPRSLQLGDAIEAALLASPATPAAIAPGRKKKPKPKLLFATGMQRTA